MALHSLFDPPSMRLTMVGCRGEEVEGEIKSTTPIWWLSSSVVIASMDVINGEILTRSDLCSPGLSSDVSTRLVNTLSSSYVGGCLV